MRQVANIGLDGSTVTATLGKTEVPLIKADYADKLEPGTLTYMGSQQIDEVTPGTYSTEEAKLTMSSLIFRTVLLPALPKSGAGMVRIPITITRSHPDLGDDSDLLENCRCTNLGAALENSNKAEEVTVNFKPQQVRWGNARKTLNQIAGETAGESSL